MIRIRMCILNLLQKLNVCVRYLAEPTFRPLSGQATSSNQHLAGSQAYAGWYK